MPAPNLMPQAFNYLSQIGLRAPQPEPLDPMKARMNALAVQEKEMEMAERPEERNWLQEQRGMQRERFGMEKDTHQAEKEKRAREISKRGFKDNVEALQFFDDWGDFITWDNYEDSREKLVGYGMDPKMLPEKAQFEQAGAASGMDPKELFEYAKQHTMKSARTRLNEEKIQMQGELGRQKIESAEKISSERTTSAEKIAEERTKSAEKIAAEREENRKTIETLKQSFKKEVDDLKKESGEKRLTLKDYGNFDSKIRDDARALANATAVAQGYGKIVQMNDGSYQMQWLREDGPQKYLGEYKKQYNSMVKEHQSRGLLPPDWVKEEAAPKEEASSYETELSQAKEAIKAGTPKDKVKALFKQRTGKEYPE